MSRTTFRRFVPCVLALALLPAATPQESTRVLASISGDSLRGHVSFIASSLLEGRDTPSPGLDLAAEYIAAQFRRIGLVAPGDDGYFQTAQMLRAAPPEGFALSLSSGARVLPVLRGQAAVVATRPVDLTAAALFKISAAADLKGVSLQGRVVAVTAHGERAAALARAVAAQHPAVLLQTEDDAGEPKARRLADPDEERRLYYGIPRVVVRGVEAVEMLDSAKAGETGILVTLNLPAAAAATVTVRNVAGLLRGSDPLLRDRYMLLTAHYDHVGRSDSGQVFPGANDDASGVASVIEIAQALARLSVHPRRSILFMAFFGEEEGSLGARYYAGHPLVPLAQTLADLNLEQVGRTDSNAGPHVADASLTGFTYSDLPRTLQAAGALTGVKVYETRNGDEYFNRSDNLPFAEHGIPAHTLAVAFEFPDYHEAGDTWQKINYSNMAKVDRMIAMGVMMLANGATPPQWNKANPNVARYLRAP